jgi:hypothetical protein
MAEQVTRLRCPVCGLEYAGELPGVCGRANCGVQLLPGGPGRLRAGTFQLTTHFSLCVLPFSFSDPERKPVWDRLPSWGRWKERAFSPDNPDDVDRTEYFLPYIRRFLFPGLSASDTPRGRLRRSCWHFDFDLSRLGKANQAGLPLTMHARDSRKNLDCVYPLLLEKVELIVFSYRVGFLVLDFHNAEPGANFFEQMDSLAYLRTLAPLYKGFEMPELTAEGQRGYRMNQLLAYLLAEFAPGPAPASAPDMPEKATLPVKPIYDDRMMVYSFSCLDRDRVPASAAAGEALLTRAAIINFEHDQGGRPRRSHERAEEWVQLRRQGFSKDGGILVVFDTDRYHARFLGQYQRTYYFDVFLLAALQRVTLLTLYESFSDLNTLMTGGGASRKLLRRVRRDLLLFKSQCWFSQITNRERGLVLWRKWQKVFENRTLLKEVNEQSDELNTYLQARYRERIEMLVRLGSFLAAAFPVIFGLERFLGQSEWVPHLRWGLLALLVVGAAVFGYVVLFRQGDEV